MCAVRHAGGGTPRVRSGRMIALALGCVGCLVAVRALPSAESRVVPERDATVIMASGMPVRIDGAIFFEDGALLAVQLRNGAVDVARSTLRVAVFSEQARLKGSIGYCAGDPMQPGIRQTITFPVELKHVSARDRFVVVLEEVLTPRRAYSLREPLAGVLAQARRSAEMSSADLTTEERTRSGVIPPCACDCHAAEQTGRDVCGEPGLAAFTCTPMIGGACSASHTCKS
jgi:hypothetical protein